MSICDETIEICTVKVELTDGYQLVMGLYRPHSGTTTDFTDKLENLFENTLVQNSKLVILVGDCNIDVLNTTDNATNNYISALQSKMFIPLITKASGVSNNENEFPSYLDHIWINSLGHSLAGILDNN